MKHVEAEGRRAVEEWIEHFVGQGSTLEEARQRAREALASWVLDLSRCRDEQIERDRTRFNGAVRALLEWWDRSVWNPANSCSPAAVPGPEPIGPSIDDVLSRALSEEV